MNPLREKKVINEIMPKMKEGEELIGFFLAQRNPSVIAYILLGYWALLMIKYYIIAITNDGIHVFRISGFYDFKEYNFYSWESIENLYLGNGRWQAPFRFKPNNSDILKFRALTRNSKANKKLDEKTREFIESKVLNY